MSSAKKHLIEVYLQIVPGGYNVVEVDQDEVMDAGIIKYKDQYYVFDGQKSKVAKPIFVPATILEIK